MKENEFKNFYQYAKEVGLDHGDVQSAGYLWINCTESQVAKLRELAMEQGFKPDENGNVKVGAYIMKKMK